MADPDVRIVVRTDSAGATHDLADYCRDGRLNLLAGFDLTEPVRQAILALGDDAWRPAIRQDGELREGAQVAEITSLLNLTEWPTGYRVIVRRERPHPGAQLSFTDHDGHRFLATLTDLDGHPVEIERSHRARANVEDRIRAAKQTGLQNLPFRDFHLNQVWLEISLIAQNLIAWTQALAPHAATPQGLGGRRRRLRRGVSCGSVGGPPKHPALGTGQTGQWAGEVRQDAERRMRY